MKETRIMKIFEQYIKKFNMNKGNIKAMYFHSLKMMELCKDIASNLGIFTDEEIIHLSNTASYYVELNASTLSYEHIKSLIDNGINTTRTRFTFNFYPKLYTGHDIIDVYNKTKICNEVGIYVGAFIPSHIGFRPPMYEGLPTVEAHRKMCLDVAIEELKACGINGIYFGDAYASTEEISILNMHNCEEILLKLRLIDSNDNYDYLFHKSFKILIKHLKSYQLLQFIF